MKSSRFRVWLQYTLQPKVVKSDSEDKQIPTSAGPQLNEAVTLPQLNLPVCLAVIDGKPPKAWHKLRGRLFGFRSILIHGC